jgi:hypothetical protein
VVTGDFGHALADAHDGDTRLELRQGGDESAEGRVGAVTDREDELAVACRLGLLLPSR